MGFSGELVCGGRGYYYRDLIAGGWIGGAIADRDAAIDSERRIPRYRCEPLTAGDCSSVYAPSRGHCGPLGIHQDSPVGGGLGSLVGDRNVHTVALVPSAIDF